MKDVKTYLSMNYPDDEIIIPEGYDEAFIGIGYSYSGVYACYNYEKVIEIIMGNSSMTYDEAIDFFDFNVIGAYTGENNPVFVDVVNHD